jgi:hypothetical protein
VLVGSEFAAKWRLTRDGDGQETGEDVLAAVDAAFEAFKKDPTNFMAQVGSYGGQYKYSKFIRGDNTPEVAKYLGYLDARELYPDFKPKTFEEFTKDLLAGKAIRPYPQLG